MQIEHKDLNGLVEDTKKIIDVVETTLSGKEGNKIEGTFKKILGWLPDPSKTRTSDLIFIKQKVMRKVQKKWYSATLGFYEAAIGVTNKTTSFAAQHGVIIAMERMSWIEHYMTTEIFRQIKENDPELDELWEEEKKELDDGY